MSPNQDSCSQSVIKSRHGTRALRRIYRLIQNFTWSFILVHHSQDSCLQLITEFRHECRNTEKVPQRCVISLLQWIWLDRGHREAKSWLTEWQRQKGGWRYAIITYGKDQEEECVKSLFKHARLLKIWPTVSNEKSDKAKTENFAFVFSSLVTSSIDVS